MKKFLFFGTIVVILGIVWDREITPPTFSITLYIPSTETVSKIKYSGYDFTDRLDEWRILSEEAALYFDGEYFFEVPPMNHTKPLHRVVLKSWKNEKLGYSLLDKFAFSFLVLVVFAIVGGALFSPNTESFDLEGYY